jgi:ketosteroid isomerase-like protein
MSRQNIELVQRLYEEWNHSGGVPPLSLIDPEVEVEVVGELLGGTYRGHVGISKLLESFWGSFEGHRIDVEECIPSGEDVVVTAHYHGRGRASGVEVEMRAWHVWTWRDGKAVRWRVLGTKEEALEAVGLSGQDAHADS